jgi:hypothetical protein
MSLPQFPNEHRYSSTMKIACRRRAFLGYDYNSPVAKLMFETTENQHGRIACQNQGFVTCE